MNFDLPAYQGRGWKARRDSLARELNSRIWSTWRVNSEWSDLRAVMLYVPGLELAAVRDPRAAQYVRRVRPSRLRRELLALGRAYRAAGVKVVYLKRTLLPPEMRKTPPNLMFMRDLFLNTPEGCILSRMASGVRAGEEKFTAAQLASLAVPLRGMIGGRGLFEGADALWLDSKTVLCGVGQRTNPQGFAQLKTILAQQGVRAIAVKMPAGVQHLLGLLQIVDENLAVVRRRKIPANLRRLLKARGMRLIELEETPEVYERHGMNFVCLARRKIIMAAHCPEIARRLRSEGIKIAASVEISELLNAAGGIACATGILARKVRP